MHSFLRICLACSLCVIAIGCNAQAPIPRDTSFSIGGSYSKEVKARPCISIATVKTGKSVRIDKDLVYRTMNGHDLLLDIYYPSTTKKKKPAVLLIYGGGWRSGDKSHNEAMSKKLALNGFVAVSAEYRLALEAAYPAAVYDLKACARWMKVNAKQYGIDTNHIAVLGCSAGGQLASLLGTTNHDPAFEDTIGYNNVSSTVHAVVNIDGTLAFKHPESTGGPVYWLGGDYEQAKKIWEDAAPLNHIDANTVPFIFLNSSIPRFHAGREDAIRKMNELHIYSEVHTFPDTPHPFWFFNPWFEPMMEKMIGFLQQQFNYKSNVKR